MADCERNAMASVSFAILMCIHVQSSKFVTSAILEVSKADELSVEVLEFLMLTTVRNACFWKRIETADPRLLTWVVLRQICSTNGRNMGLLRNN